MNETTIYVTCVNWYGRKTYKPECKVSSKFCELLNQKTLTSDDIEMIKELGFEIKTKEISL